MKILHLVYSEAVSGAEKHLKYLLPGLNKLGAECHLIVVSTKRTEIPFTQYCKELNDLAVKTTLIISKKFAVLKTAKQINAYLKQHEITTLHTHLFYADLIGALVKTIFNKKVYLISTKHGYQEKFLQQYLPGLKYKPNDYYYRITKFILSKVDKNIAVSKGIAELYYNVGLAEKPYDFIHHGIKIEEFNKKDFAKECRLGDPQLIIVGRIEKFKGHHYLIDAMKTVATSFPRIKLLVLGEGSEKNNCMQQVKNLGLQNNVIFTGFKDHPYSYISNSDVIVLPSLFEPFGLVYIEAFALKTPVVAFNTAAGNEIMTNNETALLVEKADSKGLAEKIIFLLNNKTERDAIAERAYANYLDSFTTEVMIKNTFDWYESLGI